MEVREMRAGFWRWDGCQCPSARGRGRLESRKKPLAQIQEAAEGFEAAAGCEEHRVSCAVLQEMAGGDRAGVANIKSHKCAAIIPSAVVQGNDRRAVGIVEQVQGFLALFGAAPKCQYTCPGRATH